MCIIITYRILTRYLWVGCPLLRLSLPHPVERRCMFLDHCNKADRPATKRQLKSENGMRKSISDLTYQKFINITEIL